MKRKSIEQELTIDEDYRKMLTNKLQRAFFPINEKTSFKINQLFRELTKNKKRIKNKYNELITKHVLRWFFLNFGLWPLELLIFDLNIGFLVNNCMF